MRTKGIHTVSPGWFRAHILPAYASSWDDCEAVLLADPLERRRIDELDVELKAGFERPVAIGRDHWFSRRPRVLDGVHRAITAMRAGIDIPIHRGYPVVDHCDHYDHTDLYAVTAADTDLDVLLDAAMSLSSFRSAGGPWIQCDVASGNRDTVWLHLPRHIDLRIRIAEQLRQRLQEARINATVEFTEDDE